VAKAFRTDLAEARKPVRTPAGYLQCDAYTTRAGVFEYRDQYGKVTRELRHPDDVFDPASLATMRGVPVTDLHPTFPVNSGTAVFVQRGSVGDSIKRAEGDLVEAFVCITDDGLLARVEQGQRELSMGYYCDIELESGVYNGEAFDVRQRNIRYDHCACVPKGRAGDEVRLRIDGAHSRIDAASIRHDAERGDHTTEGTPVKIKINGIETEVSEVAAQLIESERSTKDAAIAAAQRETAEAKKEADTQKGRADAAESAFEKEKKARQDASDPAKVRETIKARLELEKTAQKLGVEKLDELDDKALKVACIKKLDPEAKLDGQSDAHIDGAFGFVLRAVEKKNDALDTLRTALTPPNDGNGAKKEDAAAAAMVATNKSAVAEYRKAHGK
jgi:hypothetical protein